MQTKYLLIIDDCDGSRYRIFSDYAKAEKAFEEVKEDFINECIDNNGLSKEEQEEYREEVENNLNNMYSSLLDCYDPEGNWGLRLVEAEEEE